MFTRDICDLHPPLVEQEGGAVSKDTPTLPHTHHREGAELGEATQDAMLNDRTKGEELSDPRKLDRSASPIEKEVEVAQSVRLQLEGRLPAEQSCAVVDVGTQVTEVCERGCSPLPMVLDVAVNTVEAESGDCPGDPPLHPPVEDRGTCTEWPVEDLPSPAAVTGSLATRSGEEGEGGGSQGSAAGAGHDDSDSAEEAVEATEKLSGEFHPPQSSTPIPPEQSTSEPVLAPPSAPSIVTERVLARWSMDGWYRQGLVVRDNKDGRYLVMDDAGDSDVVAADNLVLLSREPSQSPLDLGSFVVALHPEYQGVYGPAQVTAHIFEDQYAVLMFDGRTGKRSRREMFLATEGKYTRDVEGIVAKQQEWVGQVVVARNNEDGFFYHGTIQRYDSGHFTIMSLQDGFLDTLRSDHVFGPAQKRRVIQCRDYIVAFGNGSTTSVGIPGQVIKCVGGELDVDLCHGAR